MYGILHFSYIFTWLFFIHFSYIFIHFSYIYFGKGSNFYRSSCTFLPELEYRNWLLLYIDGQCKYNFTWLKHLLDLDKIIGTRVTMICHNVIPTVSGAFITLCLHACIPWKPQNSLLKTLCVCPKWRIPAKIRQ